MNEKQPMITVAVTCYNHQKYIERLVQSILDQTFQDFEIIVYDDCSPDQSPEILRRMQAMHPDRLRLILGGERLGNQGSSRNALLDSGLIRGKYTIILDGDDYAEPTMLEQLYNCITRTGADMAVCGYKRVEMETGHVLCREMLGFPEVLRFPEDSERIAFISLAPWNKLIRTDAIGDCRFAPVRLGEDLAFMMRFYRNCRSAAFVNDAPFQYHVHASQLISNVTREMAYGLQDVALELWHEGRDTWLGDVLAQLFFIHVGISMPLRLAGRRDLMREFIRQSANRFADEFHWFRSCRLLKLKSLARHGVKGVGIWTALVCHRMRIFPAWVALFRFMTKTLHLDIKY